MSELDILRERIDLIDSDMAHLFEQRMKVVKQVADYKRRLSLPIENSLRESEILASRSQLVTDSAIREYYIPFQKEVMRLSREYQGELLKQ